MWQLTKYLVLKDLICSGYIFRRSAAARTSFPPALCCKQCATMSPTIKHLASAIRKTKIPKKVYSISSKAKVYSIGNEAKVYSIGNEAIRENVAGIS